MTSLITPVAARPSSAVPPCTPRALRAPIHRNARVKAPFSPPRPRRSSTPPPSTASPRPTPLAASPPDCVRCARRLRRALTVGVASKIGPRSQNDDFAGFGRNHEIFAVADGIGGAPRGDVAATVAVNAAVSAFEGEGLSSRR